MDSLTPGGVERDPRVQAWVEEATRGLAEEPTSRVREEILDHVSEAVADRVAGGSTWDDAVADAVAALGDPSRAGRALRRANLRPSEAKIVGSLARPVPRWILALYLLGIPAFVLSGWFKVEGSRDLAIFVVGLAGITTGIAARFWLARRLARRGRLRGALVADVFGPWLFYASLVVGGKAITGTAGVLDLAVYVGAFLAGLWLLTRLWPKIDRYRSSSG